MRKGLLIFAALGIVLMLYGCVTTHEQKLKKSGLKPVSQNELETLFIGDHTTISTDNRGSATLNYSSDGTVEIDYGQDTDTGTYKIANSQICYKWQNLKGGQEKCYKIYLVDENKYELIGSNGKLYYKESFK